jgi:hypothetical protein
VGTVVGKALRIFYSIDGMENGLQACKESQGFRMVSPRAPCLLLPSQCHDVLGGGVRLLPGGSKTAVLGW